MSPWLISRPGRSSSKWNSDKGVTCCEGCGAPRRSCWRRNWRRFHSSPALAARLPNRWGTCRRAAGRSPSPSAWSDQNSFRRWPSLSIATTGECHVPLHEIRPRQGIRPARKNLSTERRNRRSKRLQQEGFRKPRLQRRAPRTAITGRTGQDDESALGVIVESVPNPTLSEKQTGRAAKDGQPPGAFRLWLPAAPSPPAPAQSPRSCR